MVTKTSLKYLLIFAAIVLPICELCDIGTITGLSVGVWGLLYLTLISKRIKREKTASRSRTEKPQRIECSFTCKGGGWKE